MSQTKTADLFWPPPPQKARIQHIKTISKLSDVAEEKGFFSKALSFLFGTAEMKQWFVQPVGIAVSPRGIIYVTDPGANCVHILNIEDKEYSYISETKSGRLRSPVGIIVAPNGDLYVSDSELKKIFVFDEDNDLRFTINKGFGRPTGLQIIGDKLFIVDTGQNKIFMFDLEGKYISEFGKRGNGPGEFNYPVQLSGSNTLFVVDALNYRVQNIELAGNFISEFGKVGNAAGSFANPKSIAIDSDKNIYVTDALMDNFQIFNDKGELLLVVGSKGINDGEFMNPSGITIDKNDTIYIVDSLNKRLQIFRYLK